VSFTFSARILVWDKIVFDYGKSSSGFLPTTKDSNLPTIFVEIYSIWPEVISAEPPDSNSLKPYNNTVDWAKSFKLKS
jgi:hypothetical protein